VVVDGDAHGGDGREVDGAARLEVADGGEGELDGLAERGRSAVGAAGGDEQGAECQREDEEAFRDRGTEVPT
jgi:hypothetical protein